MSADFFELSLRIRQEGIHANRKYIQLVADSPTLGLEPETPFFFASAPNLVARHLGILLRTADGRPLSFERRGSTDPGPAGMAGGLCDIYDAYTEDGALYKSLVVNDYCTETTNKPPVGFSFSADPNDMPWMRKRTASINVGSSGKPEQTVSDKKQWNVADQKPSKIDPPTKQPTYCRKCGSAVDAKTKKCFGCGKQYFNARKVIPVFLVVALLSASICLNVMQYISGKADIDEIKRLESTVLSKEKQLDEQTSDIAELQNTIDSQWSTIFSQNRQISDPTLTEKADWFDKIYDGLSTGNLGYGSSSFYASESIIVVKKDDTNRTFTVTMDQAGKKTISLNGYSPMDNPAVYVHFEDESFAKTSFTTSSRSATVTINPQHVGVEVIRFTNFANFDFFEVIVIVTE